jgi:N-dimethylarginine dimethylaminohydrolase
MLSEVDRLTRLVMKHPRDAFVDDETIAASWHRLNFSAPPDLAKASDEFDALADLLRQAGAEIVLLPRNDRTTLDSIYVRDASVQSPTGMILCNMGKAPRGHEPAAQERLYRQLGFPVAGRIRPPGTLEGGDLVWLDATTLIVGQGYRTNLDGITQLRTLVGDGVTVVDVPLPHWNGVDDVMHLMSLISPVDRDLVVAHSPLLGVPFRRWLMERVRLVEVSSDEFLTMGTNVLALGRRRCLMLSGNPGTRRALEAAGCEVLLYDGAEISTKGAGGPTCLTRPLAREPGAS